MLLHSGAGTGGEPSRDTRRAHCHAFVRRVAQSAEGCSLGSQMMILHGEGTVLTQCPFFRKLGEHDEQGVAAAKLLQLRHDRGIYEPEQSEHPAPEGEEDCDDPRDATWLPC